MKILIFLLVTTLTISNVLASKEVKYDPKKDIWTSCTVTKVKDGDTLICGKYTVRIAGIDAPELKKGKKKAERYSKEAKGYLSGLLMNQTVDLQIIGSDKYKRKIAYINLGEIDISIDMLEKGYTRAYVNFPNILKEDKEILLDCERIAQENNVGMWK